ncbi:pentatricopeptide repeat-containing protein At1g61870, mitochondrial [Ricinus communis]|uniref:Pentatricopeptide repeat-containing protein, putative n=1 Tax=Ricinus communis TaxID=3988 RepID=B9RXN7_RICCO|nr:pentatricopeptide repeat-containing protein At1g61870, mitochondrial [Ricinus communis]EEF43893.1 pentatricopeptide repeat-containing protein, putative [Ricinus communis]|eukprot:XP_002518506.1 pentatricopeptide repeat-containing protein At1g61870, mitochondrial [Ricinus communis]
MALFFRLRIHSLIKVRREFSTTPLSSKERTRAAISLLKSEENPQKIIEICNSASLTPEAHLDRIAFSVAITKLSKSNNFSFIQQFLDDLRVSRPDLRTSERFAAHAIVLFGQAAMVDHAVRTFKEYHTDVIGLGNNGSVKVFNALLFACYLAKDYSEVKRVFLEFPKNYNIEPNLDSYNTVIKSFCDSESSSSGFSVLAEMDRKRLKPNATTFGHLLAGFYKEEKYEDVGKVLEMMKDKYGIRPGVSTYNIRIQSLCKLKKSAEAKALLDGMLSRQMKPNSVTYAHLIHGFCNEGDLEGGKRLFKDMVNRGYQPDSACYFTLLHYLCKGQDFETALRICKESIGKDWVPNIATMKSLVNGLAGIGKVDEAKELIAKIKEKFTKNVSTWEEIEAGLPR